MKMLFYLQSTKQELSNYLGFSSLPNQVHRKSVKKGFEFTLLVVGESGLGKSTLINSLFLTDLYPDRYVPEAKEKIEQTVSITTSTVEIEEKGVKLRLTVVDTPGFGDAIDNTDCFTSIIQYIEDQFECFLREESALNRRNIVDTRVHCCFYCISPFGHGLKPLDIAFMTHLHNKVNLIPLITKADALTKTELTKLKARIMREIVDNGIRIYDFPDCDSDEDDEYKQLVCELKEATPFAVSSALQTYEVRGNKVRGRAYPWGILDIENTEHSDFSKLRSMLITHMQDLQEVTHELHYETYRSDRLADKGATVWRKTPVRPEETEKILKEKEAELSRIQGILTRMQMQKESKTSTNY
ncbi:septin-1-like [Centruroides sculpturatus]|uniref:septin-1-like n=1 Tax=Centruroides sculpturatus TaxID=218467 RepID=UPI000C6E7681|nr:septin-1-like [Centruroides sculpturatus]